MGRARKLLLVGVGSLVLIALAGELALRVAPGRLPVWYRAQLHFHGLELSHPGLLARTPLEGYPVPGPQVSYAGPPATDLVTSIPMVDPAANPDPQRYPRLEIAIDDLGFPNREVPETAGLVVVGDSFALAAGVDRPPGLQALLAERTGETVYNLGVPGIGPTRERWLLERHGLPLRPHAVVWLYCAGNDLEDTAATIAARAAGAVTFADLPEYEPPPSSRLLDLLRAWARRARAGSSDAPDPLPGVALAQGPDAGVPFWFAPRNLHLTLYDRAGWEARPEFAVATDELRAAASSAAEIGARFVLVYVPTKAEVYLPHVADQADRVLAMATFAIQGESPVDATQLTAAAAAHRGSLDAALADVAAAEGWGYVSGLEHLGRLADAGELGYLCADTHWSPRGQAALVEPILEAIGP